LIELANGLREHAGDGRNAIIIDGEERLRAGFDRREVLKNPRENMANAHEQGVRTVQKETGPVKHNMHAIFWEKSSQIF
jgi:hypothetical protein